MGTFDVPLLSTDQWAQGRLCRPGTDPAITAVAPTRASSDRPSADNRQPTAAPPTV